MDRTELIGRLAGELHPVGKHAAARRLITGAGLGSVVAFCGAILILGYPLQAVAVTGVMALAVKLAFTAMLVMIAAHIVLLISRPGHALGWRPALFLLPMCVIGLMAIADSRHLPAQTVAGSTWLVCLTSITLMSMPVFAGVIWAFRRLAPTRLSTSGFFAGVLSGAAAAFLYALYCPETSPGFLAIWYPAGIVLAAILGTVAGPRLMQW